MPEHGREARQERPGNLGSGPHIAPALPELIGQPGNHRRIRHVLVEHLDRGAVAVTVDLNQHRLSGTVIPLGGCAFRDRQLETHREIQLLRVPGSDAKPTSLALSSSNHAAAARNWAPCPTIRSCIATATSASTNGAEYCAFARSRSTNGSMIRLTVRRNGPPSSPLSTSTPGPMARHARSITARRGWRTAIAVAISNPALIHPA